MNIFQNQNLQEIFRFAKKVDLANLKSDVDQLDIDKLKNVPINLSKFKSKTNKLDVNKFLFLLI